MNIHVRACVQSVHHQYAHMISDGHVSIDDVMVKVKTRNRKHRRRAAAKPAACAKPLMLSTLWRKGKREEV